MVQFVMIPVRQKTGKILKIRDHSNNVITRAINPSSHNCFNMAPDWPFSTFRFFDEQAIFYYDLMLPNKFFDFVISNTGFSQKLNVAEMCRRQEPESTMIPDLPSISLVARYLSSVTSRSVISQCVFI